MVESVDFHVLSFRLSCQMLSRTIVFDASIVTHPNKKDVADDSSSTPNQAFSSQANSCRAEEFENVNDNHKESERASVDGEEQLRFF